MGQLKKCFAFTKKYIRENLIRPIVVVTIIFIVSGLIAYFGTIFMPKESLNDIYTVIEDVFSSKDVVNADGSLSFWGIFLNNLRAGALISFLGLIPFLFLPVVLVVFNSVIIGSLMGIVDAVTTANVFIMFVKYILPHGIFELPALIIEGAIGVKLCLFLVRKIFRKDKDIKFSYHLKGSVCIFVLCVVPLLIIAGFIETVVLSALYL